MGDRESTDENGTRWCARVPQGYGALGNCGECSSERVCSRGNRECRAHHERVPETRVPEHETVYKPLISLIKNEKMKMA